MATKKRSTKTKQKRLKKTLGNGVIWKASLFSAIIIPCLFIILKKDSVQDTEDLTPTFTIAEENSLDVAIMEVSSKADQLQEMSYAYDQNSEIVLEKYKDAISFNNENEEISISSFANSEEPDLQIEVIQVIEPIGLDSRLQVGANYTYLNLKPQGHDSFEGSLGGMQALYEYRPMNFFYGGAKFEWREGSTYGSSGKRSVLNFDLQERLGYTFAPEEQDWLITLFSGFGYRYFSQNLNPSEGDSIRFTYNEFYVPLGLVSDYDVNSWFSLGLNLTWMPQVYPTVSIHPLKGAYWNLINTWSNFSVELPFTFAITKNKRFQVIVNPFYEFWQDGHSTAKLSDGTSLGLPGNTYNSYGADLNFTYCF